MMMTLDDIVRRCGGRRNGDSAQVRCPCHDDRHPSLSVRQLADGKLQFHCFAGCDQKAVRSILNLPTVPGTVSKRYQGCQAVDESKDQAWRDLWRNAEDLEPGDLVDIYFRSRGLGNVDMPTDIRFARQCRYRRGLWPPAMLALLRHLDGSPCGVHRTWLRPDGRGKAHVDAPKKMMPVAMPGATSGASVHLYRPGDSDTLIIGEGIETCLSLRVLTDRKFPVWSGLNATNLKRLDLPPQVRKVLIGADNDRAGIKAARALKAGMLIDGRRCEIEVPDKAGQDWNNVLEEDQESWNGKGCRRQF